MSFHSTSKSGLRRWWKALKTTAPRKVEDAVEKKEKDETEEEIKRKRIWKRRRTEAAAAVATSTV